MAKLVPLIRGKKASRRAILIWLASACVGALLIAAGVVWFVSSNAPEPSAPTAQPTVTPDPTTEPSEPPLEPERDSAHVSADFAAWASGGSEDTGTALNAEGGATDIGSIALRLESTTAAGSTTPKFLGQVLAVTPSTEYTFSAFVQTPRDNSTASNIAFEVGADGTGRQDVPLSPNWTELKWTYTTGAEETALPIRIMVLGPSAGARIDGLTAVATGTGVDAMDNGSFETYDAPTQLATKTLILATGRPSLGVAWRTDVVDWNFVDRLGAIVTAGQTSVANGIGLIPMAELPQGYYTVNIINPQDPGNPIQTPLMVIDSADTNHADPRFGVGVHLNHTVGDTSPHVASQLGFGNMRTDATWSYVEKTPAVYDFRADETAEMKAFEANGMALLPISDYGNDLYDSGDTPSSSTAIDAFAKYTSELVGHLSAKSVEVYNEFNNPPMNTSACGETAECYLPLLAATANQVRADHPGTTIVGPAIAHHDDAWLTALYQAGGLQYLDAISFHPYDYDAVGAPEFLIPALQQATDRIREYNNGVAKPIWMTELGWTTSGVSEASQAKYLIRAQTIALANNVEKFFWYDLVNDSTDPASHEGNFGLVKQASATVPALAPKPAGMAQAMLIQEVTGKAFVSRDAFADTTYSYVFGEGTTTTRVAWSAAPVSATYSSTEPVHVTTMYGVSSVLVPENGQVRVDLTDEPVFIDGNVVAAS
jgi:hypothetical protein